MKGKGKEEEVMNKDEMADHVCFVCKEGGVLLMCDHRECLKCYHALCVGKDDSFLESDDHWVCDRHTCFGCSRPAYLYCYTCKKSSCHPCLPVSNISWIKGEYGFCDICLKLALLIEENKDYDSDGAKVDLTDLGTVEGLFVDYYYVIKRANGFELKDLYAAAEQAKRRKKHQSASDLEEDEDELYEEDEDQISDYDESKRKKKRSKKKKSAILSPIKSNKNDFIGWASRSLAEFLTSIGKSTEEKMLQYDVTSVINEYVKENKLLHPEKRKMIMCDERLHSLFRRKTISRNRVHELLEPHFAENCDESEDDELEYDPEDRNDGPPKACKKQRKLEMEKESPKMDVEDNVQSSCFASIVVENIKLIYLKRSLIVELLKQPNTFEEKVNGCFVRVKSDPRDYLTTNSHQLKQVVGLKRVSNVDNNADVVLLFPVMPKEISVNLLSDDNFSEEECKELRQKMVAGEIKWPTVGDLQQKAKILHEDITKHWINRELGLLKRRINHANEKGWRHKFYELLEEKKRLETPSEQSKLLENVPKVIPEVRELNSNSEEIINDMNSDKPQSIIPCNSSVPNTGLKEDRVSEEKTEHLQLTFDQPKENNLEEEELKEACSQATKNGQTASKIDVIELSDSDDENGNLQVTFDNENGKFDDVESNTWNVVGPYGDKRDELSLSVLRRWAERNSFASNFKVWRDDEDEENAMWLLEAISIAFPKKSEEVF